MNKLEGFFELKKLSVPTVDWAIFRAGVKIPDGKLWTVRSAVITGDDFNLPRLVGVDGAKAEKFALQTTATLDAGGMVIFYPYFIAEVSGTVRASEKEVVIECVKGDLWNLVTHGNIGYSVIYSGGSAKEYGDALLGSKDTSSLLENIEKLKKAYRKELAIGRSVYAEWSFAYDSDTSGKPIGERYLVFYELRVIE